MPKKECKIFKNNHTENPTGSLQPLGFFSTFVNELKCS